MFYPTHTFLKLIVFETGKQHVANFTEVFSLGSCFLKVYFPEL